ncbi:MAG: hypothetical protein VX815_02990 [Gemmatimonadota bacterium]|nr:hypothetical protein [Gemmatimonadota bacterium]
MILGLGVSSRREDREARVFGASLQNDIEPLGARQVEVRDDEVPLLIPEQLNALITVLRMHDLIPVSRRQERFHQECLVEHVLDEEHTNGLA